MTTPTGTNSQQQLPQIQSTLPPTDTNHSNNQEPNQFSNHAHMNQPKAPDSTDLTDWHWQPPIGFKLFIGCIPATTTEFELRLAFQPYGDIFDCVILKDRYTRASKGCGFVVYREMASSDRAIAELGNKLRLPNSDRELIVRYAGPRPDEDHKLYVSMLSSQTNEEDLRQLFTPYGQLTEIVLLRQKDEVGTSKGSAFIKYTTRQAAEAAIQSLDKKVKDQYSTSLLQVRFAHTHDEKVEHFRKTPPNSSSSSLSHISPETKQQKLMNEAILMQQLNQQQIAGNVLLQSLLQQQQQIQTQQRMVQQQQQQQQQQLNSTSTATAYNSATLARAMNQLMTQSSQTPPPSMASPSNVTLLQQLQGAPSHHDSHSRSQSIYDSYQNQQVAAAATAAANYFAAQPSTAQSQPTFNYQPANNFPSAIPTMSSQVVATPATATISKDARGPEGCNLFIYNIPESYTEDDLIQLFRSYGTILSAKVQRDRQTSASKGYGFVSFTDSHAAQLAISHLNDFTIAGRKITVRLKGLNPDVPTMQQAASNQNSSMINYNPNTTSLPQMSNTALSIPTAQSTYPSPGSYSPLLAPSPYATIMPSVTLTPNHLSPVMTSFNSNSHTQQPPPSSTTPTALDQFMQQLYISQLQQQQQQQNHQQHQSQQPQLQVATHSLTNSVDAQQYSPQTRLPSYQLPQQQQQQQYPRMN